MKYTRLFTPIEVKPGFVLKNRLMMPAMHHLYTDHGRCTRRFQEYYYARAEGGLALVIVGSCRFDDYGAKDNSMSLRTDDVIPGWKEFTDGMHQRDCKVAVQLYHAGRYVPKRDVPCGGDALAPSAVYSSYTRETAPEMTVAQMREVTENWAAAAVRAQKAGFDAVEILGSAGYLLSQFLSPVTNQRTDQYGGSWENRCRFPLEVIRAVRAAVGPEYPLIFRLGAKDFIPGSNGLAESTAFAKLAQEAGIDLFNVTGGWHETKVPQLPGEVPRGGLTYLSAAIMRAVTVPVIMCNRINDPDVAEETLALGRADIIGMGRPMLADPEFANKAKTGREQEIRHCVACNQGCLANTFFDRPVKCLANGLCGREYELPMKATEAPKYILVAGGGPAGCEFAIRAAQRGHYVTLWEKSDTLGGQLNLAVKCPARYEFASLIAYYRHMLKVLDVNIHYNKALTADAIRPEYFDQVVIATGGAPNHTALPIAPDADQLICTSTEVLEGNVFPGKDVVVIGGSYIGCSVAQHLARRGSLSADQLFYLAAYKGEELSTLETMLNRTDRTVTLIEQGAKLGVGYEPGVAWPTMLDLSRLGVAQWKNSKVKEIHKGGVTVSRTDKEGNVTVTEVPCDTVVVASGVHPDHSLEEALAAKGISVVSIGNARQLGRAISAISAAAELGVTI
ncbi:MAG: FAD-dependent oxidoreductase [Oscillospiraceae bacterium]|nr:FAD-dependent oxidoreductase [Oscillospiraceae bacterium]